MKDEKEFAVSYEKPEVVELNGPARANGTICDSGSSELNNCNHGPAAGMLCSLGDSA